MTRAGVIRALDSDYTRTATMKGLAPNQVIRRHVLRNGLQPAVSVIGVQVGYVLGSLVAIEKVFNYPGLGLTIANAAAKDPPVLVAGVLVVAIVYMLATLCADLILAWMNPRASISASSEVVRAEPAGGV
jgi:peptide/nickel transport system permease protein